MRGLSAMAGNNELQLFPVRHTLRGYSRHSAAHDLRAGANLALMAFPQGMAYALIAGVPVQFGILCFIAASLVAPLFASSRFNSYGPSNATAVLILSSFLVLQLPPATMMAALPLLVLMAGIFLVIGAYMKVARLIQYVSRTVITGYITAAALLIIANQVKNVLGFDITPVSSFMGVLVHTAASLPETHWPALLLGILTGLSYYGLKRAMPTLPNVAITLVLMTFVSLLMAHFGYAVDTLAALHLEEWRFANIPVDFELVNQLAGAALALAFLITLEGTSIGKSLAARSGDRLNVNQEMFSLGMANISSAIAGGMAASASLTRSSLNLASGATTTLCNIYAAIIVAALLAGLSGFIQYIPKTSLAVLVIIIGISLISKHQIRIVSKSTRADATVFFTTLAAGLVFALDTAIYLGTAISIILFLRKVAEPELVEYTFNAEGHLTELPENSRRSNPEVSIVHVEGELFFGAAELFYDQIRRVCEDPNLRVVILKLRNAHHLDATSVFALLELIHYMRENDRILLVSEARKDAIRIFRNSGLIDVIGRENIFPDHPQNPTLSSARALKRAREFLGGVKADVSVYVDAGGKG